MRQRVRIVAKIVAVGGWTVVVLAGLFCAWIPTLVRPRSGASLRDGLRRRALRIWGRGLLRASGVRVAVVGEPPPMAALVVSNHLSYLDIPVLGSVAPMVFVAKAELRAWPLWGFAAAVAGTIFVNRATKRDVLRVRREMLAALERGDRVIVFPEATSTAGDTILPLKSALLADAALARSPVHWVTVSYRTAAGEPSARDCVCWWGDVGFVRHALGLLALKRVYCTVRFGGAALRSGDRKALAVALRHAMLRRFEPSGG